MTTPISSNVSRGEVCASETEATSSSAPTSKTPPPQQPSNSLEQWSGGHVPTGEQTGGANFSNPAAIQAQLAQEKADRALFSRAMGGLEEAVAHVANSPEREQSAATFAITNRAAKNDFFEVATKFPPDMARAAIERQIRNANPSLDKESVEKLCRDVMAHLDTFVRTESAQRMKKTVVAKMESAVKNFRKTANDPAELKRLSALLAKLESPGANPAQKDQAAKLRAGLGLENDGRPATEATLQSAISARARLMEHEAATMSGAGENTLYRRLLTQDVSGIVMRDAHIRPGSWAEAGVAGVKARGEADERQIGYAKLAASVALAGVTAGAGAGILAGMAATAIISAPEVMVAYHEIDAAAAGASAGTAAEDAEAVAARTARVKLGEAAVAVAGSAAGGGVVHELKLASPGAEALAHMVVEGAAHEGLKKGAHALESERGAASGHDALQRSK